MKPQLDHEAVRRILDTHGASRSSAIEGHLAQCAECRAYAAMLAQLRRRTWNPYHEARPARDERIVATDIARRLRRRRRFRWFLRRPAGRTVLAPVVALVVLVAAVVLTWRGQPVSAPQIAMDNVAPPASEAALAANVATVCDVVAPALGATDAPVTIIEFVDFQCPFCARHAAETMPALRESLIDSGQLRYVSYAFPVDRQHPEARLAALAAHCAGVQEAYWAMHKRLFATQALWSARGAAVAGAHFALVAAELGLDADRFEQCVQSQEASATVDAQIDAGLAYGVSRTPSFIVNGERLVVGAQSMDDFTAIVAQAAVDAKHASTQPFEMCNHE